MIKETNKKFEQIVNILIEQGQEWILLEIIPDKTKLDFVEDWENGEYKYLELNK